MIVVSKGRQVVDMIAVRLFLFEHTSLTLEIHPLANLWAVNRDIPMSYETKGNRILHYIALPEEYEQYRDWSLVVLLNEAAQDALQVSLDLLMDTGWTSIRRSFTPFNKAERTWIWENVPNHYTDLTRRKSKS